MKVCPNAPFLPTLQPSYDQLHEACLPLGITPAFHSITHLALLELEAHRHVQAYVNDAQSTIRV